MTRSEFASLSPGDRMVVRAAPMFARLGDQIFDDLTASAMVLRVPPKTQLFEEGLVASDILFVLEGWVKLYRISPGGEEAIVSMFTRSQSIAEAVALTSQTYPATAETVSECRIVRLQAAPIIHALRVNPDIALAMIASVSGHLHRLVGEVARLKGLNGLGLLIAFLTSLDDGRGALELVLPFEKHVLARHLGMQPESFSRTLKKLRNHGVEVEGRRVVLESWDFLKRAADDYD